MSDDSDQKGRRGPSTDSKEQEPPQWEALDTCRRFGLGLRRFFLGVLAAETFHPTGGIHELLLASKERMAIGADFYVDVALVGRTSAETVAARAHDANLVVSGMNGCLHGLLTSFPNHSILKDARRIQQMQAGSHALARPSTQAR